MYSDQDKHTLLKIARDSLVHGCEKHKPLSVNPKDYPVALQENKASFVTLHLKTELRGCIGTLEAHRPLAIDVTHNAFAAGFQDPRFHPISLAELDDIDISISILSKPEPMKFSSEKDLLKQIRPGVDGLILKEGLNRGTFLPSVWEQLPTVEEFLTHLKAKAGLPGNYWSDTIQLDRYITEEFSEKKLGKPTP